LDYFPILFCFHHDKQHIVPHAVYLTDFADIICRSSISLGLLREEVSDKHTQRTFEIPACGSLQIAPRNDEILSFFKEDDEIVCFDSPEELKEKVGFYLAHPASRERIARNGFKKVTSSNHTYQHRVETMLEKLSLI
jgi:spore maturation protein CgeB